MASDPPNTVSETNPGKVITFYSYRGGSGRTLAVANTACLLAKRTAGGKGVLMIDWDLTAPGLHGIFEGRLALSDQASPRTKRAKGSDQPGLIDLFCELADEVGKDETRRVHQSEEQARKIVEFVRPEKYVLATDIPGLHLMKAGRFGGDYSQRVNTFKWDDLLKKSPWMYLALATYLGEHYDYVLIDSPSGMGDTAGVCCSLMPEMLVCLFTLNHQNLSNAPAIISQALQYRRESNDLRPLVVVPVPSRIEAGEQEQLKAWRFGSQESGLPGYQGVFERLFCQEYALHGCNLKTHFDQVQLKDTHGLEFGDQLPVLAEPEGGQSDLVKAYQHLTDCLTADCPPGLHA